MAKSVMSEVNSALLPRIVTNNRVTVRFNEFPASKFPPQETLRFLENKINCFPDQDQSLFVITVEIV